jgi:hypothetical protein
MLKRKRYGTNINGFKFQIKENNPIIFKKYVKIVLHIIWKEILNYMILLQKTVYLKTF